MFYPEKNIYLQPSLHAALRCRQPAEGQQLPPTDDSGQAYSPHGIERGLLMPALPTLIDICNALGTGADSILSAYITQDTPIRWTPLAEKLGGLDLEKQHKIETILDCLIETI